MDEIQIIVFTKSGESFTPEALARKLRGAVAGIGEDTAMDDDSAIAALAGFDESENWSSNLSTVDLNQFVDEFCEAWRKLD